MKKNELFSIAAVAFSSITQTKEYGAIQTKRMKEADGYFDELLMRLRRTTLSDEQMAILNALENVHEAVVAAYSDAAIVYGMQAQAAMEEMIKEPVDFLNFSERRGTPVRALYPVE